jgi:ATP-binding cassette, subfamily B, bacterial
MWRTATFNPVPQVLSGLVWVVFHSWPLVPGLLAKAFFDLLQGHVGGLSLDNIVVLILALSAVRCGLVLAEAGLGWFAGFGVRGLLQRNLLARIFERPGASALPSGVGATLSTLRDDVEAMWGAGIVFDTVGFVCFAGGGLLILLSVNARMTLLVFVPIVFVIVMAHVLRTRLQYLRERSREATAHVTGAIADVFGAAQAIQVAGAEDSVVAHLRRLGEARKRAALRDRLLELVLSAAFENTASLGAGITLLVAASAMRAGTFSLGDFALFSTYLMQVAGMTGFLGFIVTTYQQIGVAFRRGVALMQGAAPLDLVAHHPIYVRGVLPPVAQPIKQPGDVLHKLDVKGLTLRHGDVSGAGGIEDISFSLTRGSFTVVVGRVGAGKTTLLRAVLGLLEAQAGEVRWNGAPVLHPAEFFVPPRCAYTPQVPALLSGTLRENVLLGLQVDAGVLERAIQTAMLDKDVATFAEGLEARIGVQGMRLSGGQAQRAAAARMLVRQPELLVFDDLSSALDVETEQALWGRVFELGAAWGTTCLVVSHRPAVLQQANQILVLQDGCITARGRLAELLETSEEMRRLYGLL